MTSVNHYLQLLDEFSEKLVTTVPTSIPDSEILELEGMLNDLYQYHMNLGGAADLEDAIIQALSQASELSYKIKKNPKAARDSSFFSLLKKLPRLLKVIRFYLEESQE